MPEGTELFLTPANILAMHKPPVSRRLIVLLAILLLGQMRSDRFADGINGPWGGSRGMRIVAQVHSFIREKFPYPPSDEELCSAAINAMMKLLDDRYSEYLPPRMAKFRNELLEDKVYGGIGIVPEIRGGVGVIIKKLVPGGASEKAGLHEGDIIIKVDGLSTADMPVQKVYDSLRGDLGSEVELVVQTPGDTTPAGVKSVTLIREALPRFAMVHSCIAADNPKTGYIHLPIFSYGASAQIKDAVENLKQDGMKALILDLRMNSGGSLGEALKIADFFLSGKPITIIERRTKNSGTEFVKSVEMSRPQTLGNFPMVVLVDRDSASASELLSGALQANDRATLIGERTFGKGKVQEIMPLGNMRGAIRLTVAKFMTPKNEPIDGVGIMPDIEVKLSDNERILLMRHWGMHCMKNADKNYMMPQDRQLEKAKEVLAKELAEADKDTKETK